MTNGINGIKVTMQDGWEIIEKGANNGMHILRIIVDGIEVERLFSGSMRYLSMIADNHYCRLYNQHSTSGFKYQIR
jgi:hypothetical protein